MLSFTRRAFLSLASAFPLVPLDLSAVVHARGVPNTSGLVVPGMPIARHVVAVTVDGVYHPAEDCFAADDRHGWLARWVVTIDPQHGRRVFHGRQPHAEILTGDVRFALDPPNCAIEAEVRQRNDRSDFVEYEPTGRQTWRVNGRPVTKAAYIGAYRSVLAVMIQCRPDAADRYREDLAYLVRVDERRLIA
jgi:hypothetical protein